MGVGGLYKCYMPLYGGEVVQETIVFVITICDLPVPQVSDIHFQNRTHPRTCGRFWMSFVQRAWRIADEKEDEKQRGRRRIAVKPKTATTMSGANNSMGVRAIVHVFGYSVCLRVTQ